MFLSVFLSLFLSWCLILFLLLLLFLLFGKITLAQRALPQKNVSTSWAKPRKSTISRNARSALDIHTHAITFRTESWSRGLQILKAKLRTYGEAHRWAPSPGMSPGEGVQGHGAFGGLRKDLPTLEILPNPSMKGPGPVLWGRHPRPPPRQASAPEA